MRLPTPLRSVFGGFSHNLPEAPKEPEPPVAPEPAPERPSEHHGYNAYFVQKPAKGFDGSAENPPWSFPEAEILELLRTAVIEFVEERGLDGLNGAFWGRIRDQENRLRSVLLRFDGIHTEVYQLWGQRYDLDPGRADYSRRELAAYEAAKALGMEDMVAPMVPRHVNLVPLISDAVREKVAGHLRIPAIKVDETFGINALVQLLPLEAECFAQRWATLGASDEDRWMSMSSRLRHSVYRAAILEFLLNVDGTTLASGLHNRTLDNVAHYNLGISLPDPRLEVDRYLALRAQGWSRAPYRPTETFVPARAPYHCAFLTLLKSVPEKHKDQCLMTVNQVAGGVADEVGVLLGRALHEHHVPPKCIAGLYARIAFLAASPEAVMGRSEELLQSVLTPIRRGFGTEEGPGAAITEYVNYMMTTAFESPFDFGVFMQEQLAQ